MGWLQIIFLSVLPTYRRLQHCQIMIVFSHNVKRSYNDVKITNEIVKELLIDHLSIEVDVEDFRKNPKAPFSLSLDLKFHFSKHWFEVYLNEDIVFEKLYNQDFNEKELKDLINRIGRSVTSIIEERTNLK